MSKTIVWCLKGSHSVAGMYTVGSEINAGDSFLDGVFGEFSYAIDIQLTCNILTMPLHGFYAHMEDRSNFFCALALCQKLEYLTLSG